MEKKKERNREGEKGKKCAERKRTSRKKIKCRGKEKNTKNNKRGKLCREMEKVK